MKKDEDRQANLLPTDASAPERGAAGPGERRQHARRQQGSPLAADAPRQTEPSEALAPAPGVGVLVTNHLNLMYMLAAGLLMPPSGFAEKHYRDSLAAFPGWLPLFIGQGRKAARAPQAALEDSTAEAKHLKPVLVEVDLAGLRGAVHAFGEGGWAARRLEEGVGRGDWLALLPAPLPVSRVRRVLLRSAAEGKELATEAGERSNVPLASFKRAAAKRRFPGDASFPWPPTDGAEAPAERRVSLAAAQAAGGAMAALQQMANGGDLSFQACRAAFDPSADSPADGILGGISAWASRGVAAAPGEEPRTGRDLFWGAVQHVVAPSSAPASAEDSLIDFLQASSESLQGDARDRAADLVSTLDDLAGGLGGGSVGAMLERHRTPLARAAILFLLRQKTQDLLELIEDYPQLDERDRLAAGILFGVRDGWLKLPLALRGPWESTAAVTHRMAALAHRLDESGFDLGEAPPRVQPLRELFVGPETWEAKRERAALRLARGMKWRCVRTRVSLGKGTYEFRVEGGSAHIDFEGEPRIAAKVDRERFLAYLARDRVDPRVEAAVRKELGV